MKKSGLFVFLNLVMALTLAFSMQVSVFATSGSINCSSAQTREQAAEETKATNLSALKEFYHLNSDDQLLIDTADEFIGFYEGDEVFKKHLKADNTDAIGMVKKVIDAAYLRRTGAPNTAPRFTVANVKLIMQAQNNWCGACSVLQVLYGRGQQGSVSGTTDTAKQTTLSKNMGNLPGGPSTDALSAQLNKYDWGNWSYIPVPSSMAATTFKTTIDGSFNRGGPVIFQTNPSQLSYYPASQTTGHYIVAEGLSGDTVKLVDCNYQTAYYGRHNEPAANVLSATKGKYMVGIFS